MAVNHIKHVVNTMHTRSVLEAKVNDIFNAKIKALIGEVKSADEVMIIFKVAFAEYETQKAMINAWYSANIHADLFPHHATTPPSFD